MYIKGELYIIFCLLSYYYWGGGIHTYFWRSLPIGPQWHEQLPAASWVCGHMHSAHPDIPLKGFEHGEGKDQPITWLL